MHIIVGCLICGVLRMEELISPLIHLGVEGYFQVVQLDVFEGHNALDFALDVPNLLAERDDNLIKLVAHVALSQEREQCVTSYCVHSRRYRDSRVREDLSNSDSVTIFGRCFTVR